MAKIEKKEEVKPAENIAAENKPKQTSKSYAGIACLIVLLCCAGSVVYNIELTKTLNEDLAAQLADDYNSKIGALK